MSYYIYIKQEDLGDIYDGVPEVLTEDGEPKQFESFEDAQQEIMTTPNLLSSIVTIELEEN